jgi:hypothetical protein
MKKEELPKEELFKNAMSFISGSGNLNYLREHVSYFEKNLPGEIAPYEGTDGVIEIANYAYLKCHSFVAWIRLYAEFICNLAMATLSRAEFCQDKMVDYSFHGLTEKTIKKARKACKQKGVSAERFEKMKRSFKMTIELRHTTQHGGIPWVIRDKAKFPDIDLFEVAEMFNPIKYRETKEIFLDAKGLIDLLPKPTIRVGRGGSVSFLDKEENKIKSRPIKS